MFAEISFIRVGVEARFQCIEEELEEKEVETATMETKLLMKGERKMQQKLTESMDFKKISFFGLGFFHCCFKIGEK